MLSRIDGPVIFAANHASHLDTPLILLSLPDEWRRRTAVAAAADYFFDTWWRAVGLGDRVQHLPDRPPRRLDGDHARRGAGRRLEPGDLPRGHPLQGRLGRPLPARARRTSPASTAYRSSRSRTAAPSPRCRAARAGRARAAASSRSGSASRCTPSEGESPRDFAPRIRDAVAALLDEDKTTWWEARRRQAAGATPRGHAARRGQEHLVGGPAPSRVRRHPRPRRPGDRPVAAGVGADDASGHRLRRGEGASLEAVTTASLVPD